MTHDENSLPFDTTIAHPARRYDYWLDGKDNFAADRESGDAIAAVFPHIRTAVHENRKFLHRTVRFLTAEAGIRQFLDIGTGLPTADNTHEIAQRVIPAARIVYVDNDPLVLAHARALLTSNPAGRTNYLDADLRDPATILRDNALTHTLDLKRPVALLLIGVLHFLADDEKAYAVVKTLLDALPSGSFLAATHGSSDLLPESIKTEFATRDIPGAHDFTDRSRDQFARFFDGLDLVEPGIKVVSQWRPDPEVLPPLPEQVAVYGAVAQKP